MKTWSKKNGGEKPKKFKNGAKTNSEKVSLFSFLSYCCLKKDDFGKKVEKGFKLNKMHSKFTLVRLCIHFCKVHFCFQEVSKNSSLTCSFVLFWLSCLGISSRKTFKILFFWVSWLGALLSLWLFLSCSNFFDIVMIVWKDIELQKMIDVRNERYYSIT